MAKLYFRHGTVSSAKTLNLLAVAHNYKIQAKKVLLVKPQLDDRFGLKSIKSRAGLEKDADILLELGTDADVLSNLNLDGIFCILVDEAQFLSPRHIEQFREIATVKNIPVICYGLRTDFKLLGFPASIRLMELADSIEEVKTTCFYCNKKATCNLKHSNGKPIREGPSVDLGCEEKYLSACFGCYRKTILESENSDLEAPFFN